VSDSLRVLFPLRDHNPRTRFPVVTLLLIAANAVAFLFELSLGAQGREQLVLAGGAIPYEIVNWVDIAPADFLPLPGSIFTSMFLHGGWMHLIGNMWFLWIFGDNIEEHLGTIRYVIFYLIVGIAGALAQAFSLPSSTAPMTCSGTMTSSKGSSRIARINAVRSGTETARPKPNRWRTVLASVSGPAAPATIIALRVDTIRWFTERAESMETAVRAEGRPRGPREPGAWCPAPCEADRAHAGETDRGSPVSRPRSARSASSASGCC